MGDEAAAALSLMAIGSAQQAAHRIALTERFEKIQGARPGGPPNVDGGKKVSKNLKTLSLINKPKQNARSRRYNR